MPQSQWPVVTGRPARDAQRRGILRAVREGPEPIRGASNADSFGLAVGTLWLVLRRWW